MDGFQGTLKGYPTILGGFPICKQAHRAIHVLTFLTGSQVQARSAKNLIYSSDAGGGERGCTPPFSAVFVLLSSKLSNLEVQLN